MEFSGEMRDTRETLLEAALMTALRQRLRAFEAGQAIPSEEASPFIAPGDGAIRAWVGGLGVALGRRTPGETLGVQPRIAWA
jgi:hypothetical protein